MDPLGWLYPTFGEGNRNWPQGMDVSRGCPLCNTAVQYSLTQQAGKNNCR